MKKPVSYSMNEASLAQLEWLSKKLKMTKSETMRWALNQAYFTIQMNEARQTEIENVLTIPE